MFSLTQCLVKIKRYLRGSPGVPFIIAFQVLLLVCAGLLIAGNAELANEIAKGAYFSLVVGAVLHLVSFLKHGTKGECD